MILSTVCSRNFRYFYGSYRASSHKPRTLPDFQQFFRFTM